MFHLYHYAVSHIQKLVFFSPCKLHCIVDQYMFLLITVFYKIKIAPGTI